jgi:CBS domain-containing protein
MPKLVKDIMIRAPLIIERNSILSLIIKTFHETSLDILPVVDDDRRLVGVIHMDDIAKMFEPYSGPMSALVKTMPFLDDFMEKEFSASHLKPEVARLCIADDIMGTNFITLSEDMTLEKAYSVFRIYKTNLACVVNDARLVGMARLVDIIVGIVQ